MKFGSVNTLEGIDFSFPDDHPDTERVLSMGKGVQKIFVGCAKWSRQELKNFYPPGIKDELKYYSTRFNAIELNATFYSHFSEEQLTKWVNKTPEEFKFFPKVHRMISHIKRLKEVELPIEKYVKTISIFKNKLGMCFLQLHDNFTPKDKERLFHFLSLWPKNIPMGVELRNTDWHNDPYISREVYGWMEHHRITHIITDTAGRRDLLHMRLTSPTTFIRYVGANDEVSDYTRLDDWVTKLSNWCKNGLENIYFFVHQNTEKKSPLLAEYFIRKLDEKLGISLKRPFESTNFLF